jgi:LmbE family N-acetylglucosaminyl deacetylase
MTDPAIRAVYVSPHFDDIALSCGGWAAAAAADGRPGLGVTVFAGPPPGPLHAYARRLQTRWGEPDAAAGNRLRRDEDAAALARLGLEPVWLPFPDAVYRPVPYDSHAAIFGKVAASEWTTLLPAILAALRETLAARGVAPPVPLYVPLGVGHHVDHQLTHAAGLALREAGWPVWVYVDYPYAAQPGVVAAEVARLAAAVAPARPVPAVRDITATLPAKIAAITAYASQMSSLFPSLAAVPAAVHAYAAEVGAPTGLAGAERYWAVRDEAGGRRDEGSAVPHPSS